jgi:hypothetical protein
MSLLWSAELPTLTIVELEFRASKDTVAEALADMKTLANAVSGTKNLRFLFMFIPLFPDATLCLLNV